MGFKMLCYWLKCLKVKDKIVKSNCYSFDESTFNSLNEADFLDKGNVILKSFKTLASNSQLHSNYQQWKALVEKGENFSNKNKNTSKIYSRQMAGKVVGIDPIAPDKNFRARDAEFANINLWHVHLTKQNDVKENEINLDSELAGKSYSDSNEILHYLLDDKKKIITPLAYSSHGPCYLKIKELLECKYGLSYEICLQCYEPYLNNRSNCLCGSSKMVNQSNADRPALTDSVEVKIIKKGE